MANQNRTGQRAGAGQRGQARTRGAAARRATGTRAAAGRATGTRAAAGRAQAAQRETATTRRETATTRAATTRAATATERHGRTLTVTIPGRAADIVMLPVAAGRRVLTARTGLPVYVGLGVLAAVDVIELPVAAAVGVGYAALRRWGPLHPARGEPDGRRAPSS